VKAALLVSGLLLLGSGCAFVHSRTRSTADGEVTTVVTSYTLWDGNAALAKFQNRGMVTRSNEWAPGTSIGSLNQQTTSTNINDLIGTVVGAAVRAAAKP
jgi:hypothetical protein